jgi:16S rRNA processing protein RimM
MIAIGIIRKPHGVRGEASVEAWTGSLDRFDGLKSVTLVSPDEKTSRVATIDGVRVHVDRVLMKFAGIDTPEDLRELQNWTLEIPDQDARTLEANEYFLHDLVGLALVDEEGRSLGKVIEIEEGAGGVLLVVQGARKFDVPFAEEICRKVDLATKTITVRLPEGLDEI